MLRNIKGLKYPDEMLIRFFFKTGLHGRAGKVVEFGCDNGCNLQLFAEFGHTTLGLDLNESSISNANENFKLYKRENYRFVCGDMYSFLKELGEEKFDTVLIPSSVYYLPKELAVNFIKDARKIMTKGTSFYLRLRDFNDYRSLNGRKINDATVKIDFETTGEAGATLSFFSSDEIKELLKTEWNPESLVILKASFENYQNNVLINNSDIIAYGAI